MRRIQSTTELGLQVHALSDIPALLGAIYGLDGLILLEADLGPEFFRLSSGLLGEVFQKLVNYRIPASLVLADASAYGERFIALSYEHARHPHIRFFNSEAEARSWIQRLP